MDRYYFDPELRFRVGPWTQYGGWRGVSPSGTPWVSSAEPKNSWMDVHPLIYMVGSYYLWIRNILKAYGLVDKKKVSA